MLRKFECWKCHSKFEADDAQWVECPHCHSDNVEYATWHMPKTAKIGALGCGTLFVLTMTVLPFIGKQEKDPRQNVDEHLVVVSLGGDTIVVDPTIIEPTKLSLASAPSFDGEKYSCIIQIEYAPSGSFKYQIIDSFEEMVVAESSDGSFSGVPVSESSGGSYRVRLVDVSGNALLFQGKVIEAPISGFIKQVKPETKMSVEQLQHLLDIYDNSLLGLGENDFLAPNYKLSFIGLDGVINIPTILAQVIEKLQMGDWESATVTKLGYDDMNRISEISLQVVNNIIDF